MSIQERNNHIKSFQRITKESSTPSKKTSIKTNISDDAFGRRSRTSITYKVRKLSDKELIDMCTKAITISDGNTKYLEKASEIIKNNESLDRHRRIILEAFCRGCKKINIK